MHAGRAAVGENPGAPAFPSVGMARAEGLMLVMNQHSWQGSLLALSDERNLWPCVFVTSTSATYNAVDTFRALRTRRGRRGGAGRPLLGLSARCGRGATLHLRETVDRRRR